MQLGLTKCVAMSGNTIILTEKEIAGCLSRVNPHIKHLAQMVLEGGL